MASVLVPFWPSDPHRVNAWRWVRTQYESLGWQVVEGTATPWSKAAAIADALDRADHDTLIIADADCWVPNVAEAVTQLDRHPWVIPHDLVLRLTQTATADLLAGGLRQPSASDLDNPPYHGTRGGGVVAIHRDTYRDIPMDPRFGDRWGGDDHAWGIALHKLAGRPWIGQADLLHLWHPPQAAAPEVRGPRAKQTIPDPTNRALDHRYRDAKASTRRMQALVNEAREATWQATSASS